MADVFAVVSLLLSSEREGCVDVVSCLRDMVWGWEWLE